MVLKIEFNEILWGRGGLSAYINSNSLSPLFQLYFPRFQSMGEGGLFPLRYLTKWDKRTLFGFLGRHFQAGYCQITSFQRLIFIRDTNQEKKKIKIYDKKETFDATNISFIKFLYCISFGNIKFFFLSLVLISGNLAHLSLKVFGIFSSDRSIIFTMRGA